MVSWRNLINRSTLDVGKIIIDGDGERCTMLMVSLIKMGNLYKVVLSTKGKANISYYKFKEKKDIIKNLTNDYDCISTINNLYSLWRHKYYQKWVNELNYFLYLTNRKGIIRNWNLFYIIIIVLVRRVI